MVNAEGIISSLPILALASLVPRFAIFASGGGGGGGVRPNYMIGHSIHFSRDLLLVNSVPGKIPRVHWHHLYRLATPFVPGD